MSLNELNKSAFGIILALIGAATLAGCSSNDATSRKSNANGGSGGGGGNGNGGDITNVNTGGAGNYAIGDGGPPPSGTGIADPTSPFVKDDTGGAKLDGPTLTALKMGGASCTTPLLYPFEGTMFPVGAMAPIVQWKGAADAAYVRMTYGDLTKVSYEFAVAKSDPGRIQIPDDAWNEVSGRTATPPAQPTPLQVTVTVKSGSTLSTCKQNWAVAPGRLDGTIYYNSYDDPSVAAAAGYAAGEQGAVLRLFMGQPKPSIFIMYNGAATSGTGPCISCHSVSAKGGIMATSLHSYDFSNKVFDVFGWDIGANPNPPFPPLTKTPILAGTFGALTPDGAGFLTIGNPDCTAGAETYPRAPNNFPAVEGSVVAKLWDIRTATSIQANGLNPDWYMWMPQFNSNGDKVVFNHAKKGPNGRTDRRELATMDYDAASRTFANLQVIYHDDGPAPSLAYDGYTMPAGAGTIPKGANGCTTSATGGGGNMYYGGGMSYPDSCTDLCYPGWPFFTPDSKKVIFVRGTEPDFVSAVPGARTNSSHSRLFIVDLDTKAVHALDNANGMKPDGTAAIPNPAELSYEFFPTMMPIAAGGQFWLFWTSRRTYGNFPQNNVPMISSTIVIPDPGVNGTDAKKIWVSAIDIDAPANADPSHPGFYLQGQGISGNMRAFPVLSPCKGDMGACGTGIDCCSGYCIDGMCGSQPPTCAHTQDKCTDSADCCDKGQRCYGGFCAIPPPPK